MVTKVCTHPRKIGDNHGESCQDCGEQLSGYGYGGWFGSRLTGTEKCIHLFAPMMGPDGGPEICIYCEEFRKGEITTPDETCVMIESAEDLPEVLRAPFLSLHKMEAARLMELTEQVACRREQFVQQVKKVNTARVGDK